MSADSQDLGQEDGQESTVDPSEVVDFNFLKSQTFSDEALERDVLDLYVTQSRQILSTISALDSVAQGEMVHLAKGSAQGIGARAVAEAAARYEVAKPGERRSLVPVVVKAIEAAVQAATRRLAELGA